ncbi:MAG: hypothetical protein ABSG75_17250 [Syntrophales bacterium]|jgi:hypothetical protein
MAYSDKKGCKVGDRKILHGEFASLSDRCVICNDGRLEENYADVFGGIVGGGTGGRIISGL